MIVEFTFLIQGFDSGAIYLFMKVFYSYCSIMLMQISGR